MEQKNDVTSLLTEVQASPRRNPSFIATIQPRSDANLTENNPLRNTLIMVIVATGGYYFGFFVGVFNVLSTPLVTKVYGMTDPQKIANANGNISSLFTFGNLIGAVIIIIGTDFIGRRRLLIISELCAFFLFFAYRIENYQALLVCRLICGILAAVNSTIVPIYITEMIPRSKSGKGNILMCLTSVCFTFFGLGQQQFFGEDRLLNNWKLVLSWPIPLSAIRLLLLIFVVRYETPLHVFKKAKGNDAIAKRKMTKVLRSVYDKESAQRVCEAMLEVERSKMVSEDQRAGLLSKRYRMRFLAGLFCQLGQEISGINFLIFFSKDLFEKVSGNGGTMACVIGAANVVGNLSALWLIEWSGRKINIQLGAMVQALSFFALFFSVRYDFLLKIIPPIAVSLYTSFFALGLGSTLVSFITEILPPRGVGISFIMQYAGSTMIAKYSQPLELAIGSSWTILLFGVVCLFLFFAFDVVVIETKGKNELEITDAYMNFKYKPFNFQLKELSKRNKELAGKSNDEEEEMVIGGVPVE